MKLIYAFTFVNDNSQIVVLMLKKHIFYQKIVQRKYSDLRKLSLDNRVVPDHKVKLISVKFDLDVIYRYTTLRYYK